MINDPKLIRDFKEFYQRMRLNRHFRKEPTPEFNDWSAFSPKSPFLTYKSFQS